MNTYTNARRWYMCGMNQVWAVTSKPNPKRFKCNRNKKLNLSHTVEGTGVSLHWSSQTRLCLCWEIIKTPLFQMTVELSVIWMRCCDPPLRISVNSKATRHHYPAVLRHMHSIYLIRFHCKVCWLTSQPMHAPTCRHVLLFRCIKLLKRVQL